MVRRRPKRRSKRNNKPKAQKSLSVGLPQSQMLKLRYTSELTLTPGASGIADVDVYSLNGMFDPDITGTGHQPRGFDQYMALYDKYLVLGCKVSLQAVNTSATTQNRVGMSVRTHYTPDGYGVHYTENGHTTSKLLAPYVGGNNVCKLAYNWSCKKWFRKTNITDEYDLTGDTTKNPTTQAYLHVWTANPWGLQDGTIKYVLNIDYVVLFREPIQVTQS